MGCNRWQCCCKSQNTPIHSKRDLKKHVLNKPKTTTTNGSERDGAFNMQNSLNNGGNHQRVILFSSRDRASSAAKTF